MIYRNVRLQRQVHELGSGHHYGPLASAYHQKQPFLDTNVCTHEIGFLTCHCYLLTLQRELVAPITVEKGLNAYSSHVEEVEQSS